MRPLLVTALALALGAGCSVDSANGSDPSTSGGSAGVAGSQNSDEPSALSFEPLDPIVPLDTRAEVELVVHALPARAYHVRFSLPSESVTVNPKDAALEASEVDSDETGRAAVRLTTSSTSATFFVRASVGSVVTNLPVTVAGPGGATLRVEPVQLGHRQATTWVASVHEGKKCAELKEFPPEDGPNVERASALGVPVLRNVPTGYTLAITLRSGYFMGGCTTVEPLPAEVTKTPRVVPVSVLDRPIELAESSLSLSLGLSETGGAWESVLTQAQTAVLAGLHGSTSVSDVDALLDAMQASLPAGAQQQSFQNARLLEDWDAIVAQKWGSATKMTDLVSGWLASGKGKLVAGDQVFVGFLAATDGGKANYALDTIAGISALDAGFSQDAQVTWSAGPDDTVLLSTFVYFSSSRFLTGLAEPAILLSQGGAASVGAALSTELSCATLGGAIAAAGNDSELAYVGCDGACLTMLCSTALVSIWQRARDAALPMQLGIAATGQGFVGDEAELSGMRGSWVGKLALADGELSTSGALTGGQPPLSAP
jgi:hypothetical protein